TRLVTPRGLPDGEDGVEVAPLRDLEAVAVLVALARDVPRERVAAVGRPEPRPLVRVEREDLLRQAPPLVCLDREAAVDHVVLLGAVLEEEPVPPRLVAHPGAGREV